MHDAKGAVQSHGNIDNPVSPRAIPGPQPVTQELSRPHGGESVEQIGGRNEAPPELTLTQQEMLGVELQINSGMPEIMVQANLELVAPRGIRAASLVHRRPVHFAAAAGGGGEGDEGAEAAGEG